MSERPPDFDALVGDELDADERERLRRVHELLVAAGPPPDAPARAPVIPLARRRRRGALLAVAAALAVAAFAVGVAVGDSRGETVDFTISMSGAADAAATIDVFPKDEAGNWPMELEVDGLAPPREGRLYELWLTRGGEPYVLCGSFLTTEDGTRGDPDERPLAARRVRRLDRRRGRLAASRCSRPDGRQGSRFSQAADSSNAVWSSPLTSASSKAWMVVWSAVASVWSEAPTTPMAAAISAVPEASFDRVLDLGPLLLDRVGELLSRVLDLLARLRVGRAEILHLLHERVGRGVHVVGRLTQALLRERGRDVARDALDLVRPVRDRGAEALCPLRRGTPSRARPRRRTRRRRAARARRRGSRRESTKRLKTRKPSGRARAWSRARSPYPAAGAPARARPA